MTKGILAPIAKNTSDRFDRRFGRVFFVHLSGEKQFHAPGAGRYAIDGRDDHSQFMWVYLLPRKSGDASDALERFLCEIPEDGEVAIIRSDGGSVFQGRRLQQLFSDERRIPQELTPPHSPQYNGCAQRGLAMLETTSRVARIQA